jgi:hypothetical protein
MCHCAGRVDARTMCYTRWYCTGDQCTYAADALSRCDHMVQLHDNWYTCRMMQYTLPADRGRPLPYLSRPTRNQSLTDCSSICTAGPRPSWPTAAQCCVQRRTDHSHCQSVRHPVHHQQPRSAAHKGRHHRWGWYLPRSAAE